MKVSNIQIYIHTVKFRLRIQEMSTDPGPQKNTFEYFQFYIYELYWLHFLTDYLQHPFQQLLWQVRRPKESNNVHLPSLSVFDLVLEYLNTLVGISLYIMEQNHQPSFDVCFFII